MKLRIRTFFDFQGVRRFVIQKRNIFWFDVSGVFNDYKSAVYEMDFLLQLHKEGGHVCILSV